MLNKILFAGAFVLSLGVRADVPTTLSNLFGKYQGSWEGKECSLHFYVQHYDCEHLDPSDKTPCPGWFPTELISLSVFKEGDNYAQLIMPTERWDGVAKLLEKNPDQITLHDVGNTLKLYFDPKMNLTQYEREWDHPDERFQNYVCKNLLRSDP